MRKAFIACRIPSPKHFQSLVQHAMNALLIGKSPQEIIQKQLTELWQNHHAENREAINEKRKYIVKLGWIVVCEGLRLRKTNRQDRHIKTEKHRKGVEGEAVMEKSRWGYGGSKGGQNWVAKTSTTSWFVIWVNGDMLSFITFVPGFGSGRRSCTP